MKDISWARNIAPTEYNQFLIDAIDIVLDKAAEIGYEGMLNQLFDPERNAIPLDDRVKIQSPYYNDNFKEYLEQHFTSFFRANTMGCVPAIMVWNLGFEPIRIQMKEELAFELFRKDIMWWSKVLKKSYNDEYPFEYTIAVYYDLSANKFKHYL